MIRGRLFQRSDAATTNLLSSPVVRTVLGSRTFKKCMANMCQLFNVAIVIKDFILLYILYVSKGMYMPESGMFINIS